MKKDLKELLIYDKIELIRDECNAFLDLSGKLGFSSVVLRIIAKIISQCKMLEGLIDEESNE